MTPNTIQFIAIGCVTWSIFGMMLDDLICSIGTGRICYKFCSSKYYRNSSNKQKAFIGLMRGPIYWIGKPLFEIIKLSVALLTLIGRKLGDK